MKKTFFKSLLLMSMAVCLFSCKDDNSPLDDGNTPQGVNVTFDYSQAKLSRSAGSTATLNGTSDVAWKIEIEEGEFFSVEPMEGAAGEFTLTVKAEKDNTSTDKQYSKFIFNAAGRKYPITVIHLEDDIRLEPSYVKETEFKFDKDGELLAPDLTTKPFTATSNTEWTVKTVSETDTWIKVGPEVGEIGENLPISLEVEANPYAEVRTGKFEVRVPESMSFSYTVSQEAADLKYSIKDGDNELTADNGFTGLAGGGDTRTITLKANAGWEIKAAENSEWLKFEPSEGVASLEDVSITMTVEPNENMQEGRKGAFTVTFGNGISITINAKQNNGEIPEEVTELLALKVELEGSNNNVLNWDISTDYNSWEGVKFEGGKLTELKLSGKGLKGYIPEGIKNFTSLRVLDLSNNELTATPNLQAITYGNSDLSGGASFKPAVPVDLIKLENLETLKLSRNNINGVFPSDLVAHPHYFDWNAMENIYPQKDDNADITYEYGSGAKYETTQKGDPSKWKLRLTSTGILRVMYYKMGGDKWTWATGSGANQFPENSSIDAWLKNECYFSNVSYGTAPNIKIVGISLVSSNKEAISGSGSYNIGAFSYINNLNGELPLEILMNQNIQHFRAFGSQIEGRIHPLMLQRINYLQVTNSPNIQMDIKDIVANLHPQIKNCDLSGNIGITGTISRSSLPELVQGKTDWSDVLANTGVTLE